MKKTMLKSMFPLLGFMLFSTHVILAQGDGNYQQYQKTMNSLVPGTPEASGIMKYIDFPVSFFTGQPNINIPICQVKGKELSLPISLSYNATSGIKVSEIAGNTGLGFVLFAGGEITREVRGKPDESGLMNNGATKVIDYVNTINNSPIGPTARNAATGQLDLEPDLFYFSFGANNGKFVYDEMTTSFLCTESQPYKITYDKPSSTWTIIGPDGSLYRFDKKVETATKQECNNVLSTAPAPFVTTAWKLTKVVNANRTDSLLLEYDYNSYSYYSEGSSIKYQHLPQPNTTTRMDINCFNKNDIQGWDKILKISSALDTVSFEYASTTREDLSGQSAMSKIIHTNGNPSAKTIFKFEYDYYNRNYVVGIRNAQTSIWNKKSLRLKEIVNYGNSESNSYPLSWKFFYNGNSLPARLSYCQDFWGYYNNNGENYTLAPKNTIDYGDGVIMVSAGADRIPDLDLVKSGILEKIQFPTGGTTSFEYESNEVGYPVQFAHTNVQTISIDTAVGYPFTASATYTKTFVINSPPDPLTNYNRPEGGAYVSVHFDPTPIKNTPVLPNGSNYANDVYYTIDARPYNTGETDLWLPNGTHTIKIMNVGYLNLAPYVPSYAIPGNPDYDGSMAYLATYQLTYKKVVPEASGVINRQLGGTRIKSIVSTDSIGNNRIVKQYAYRDPITDSSYGFFTGSTYHENRDYLVKQEPFGGAGGIYYVCSEYEFLARHGNCVMPGNNALGAAVVYPKVIEYTIDGNKKYKTEYTYKYSYPIQNGSFPFVPSYVNTSAHGLLLSSSAFKTTGSNYTEAKTVKNNYDFFPLRQFIDPGTPFTTGVKACKVSYAGFTDDPLSCDFDRPYLAEYAIPIHRADLIADTTITYDLNNQYNSVKEWNSYTYGDYNHLPVITQSGNSDGSVNIQKNYYAIDKPDANAEVSSTLSSAMAAANRVSMPLGSRQYKDGQQLSRQYTYGRIDGSRFLLDSMMHALFNEPRETEIRVKDYDDYANPLTVELRGNQYRKYIWNKAKGLPLATCTMPENGAFFFSSFEYASMYPTAGLTTVSSFSGSSAYSLNSGTAFTLNGFNSSTGLDVYVWTTAYGLTANGVAAVSTGKTKGSWTLYKVSLSAASSVTISSSSYITIDQLVIVPTGGIFEGNVYDSQGKVTAKINNSMITTFFDYDDFGRLMQVKDEQGFIMNRNTYQYQGAQ